MKLILKLFLLAVLGLGGVVVVRAILLVPEEVALPMPVQVEVPPGAVERFAG